MTVLAQHEEALALANEVRLARAAVRRKIAALPAREGREAVCAIVMDPAGIWARERLDRVLRFPFRCGDRFSLVVRQRAGDVEPLRPNKFLGELTVRQRARVCAAIRGQL